MKRAVLTAVLVLAAATASAQQIDIVGTWHIEFAYSSFGVIYQAADRPDWYLFEVQPGTDKYIYRFNADGTGQHEDSKFVWSLDGSNLEVGFTSNQEEHLLRLVTDDIYLSVMNDSDDKIALSTTLVWRRQ